MEVDLELGGYSFREEGQTAHAPREAKPTHNLFSFDVRVNFHFAKVAKTGTGTHENTAN